MLETDKVFVGSVPTDPPRFMALTPHRYHDTALNRPELEDAYFSRITIETIAAQSRAHPRACQPSPIARHAAAQRNRDPGPREAGRGYRLCRRRDRLEAWQRRGDVSR
jgi:hypothetical protein